MVTKIASIGENAIEVVVCFPVWKMLWAFSYLYLLYDILPKVRYLKMHTYFKKFSCINHSLSTVNNLISGKLLQKSIFAMQFLQTFRWSNTKFKVKIIHSKARVSLWGVIYKSNIDLSSSQNLCKNRSNKNIAAYSASCHCHFSKTLFVPWWQTSWLHLSPHYKDNQQSCTGRLLLFSLPLTNFPTALPPIQNHTGTLQVPVPIRVSRLSPGLSSAQEETIGGDFQECGEKIALVLLWRWELPQ